MPCSFGVDRRGDGTAIRVAEHEEERRLQMATRVLQASCDFRRNHVSRNADDEQFAEAGSENQLGRNPRIAATQNGRVGMLAFCEIGENFFLRGREMRRPGDESLIARFEAWSASAADTVDLAFELILQAGCCATSCSFGNVLPEFQHRLLTYPDHSLKCMIDIKNQANDDRKEQRKEEAGEI